MSGVQSPGKSDDVELEQKGRDGLQSIEEQVDKLLRAADCQAEQSEPTSAKGWAARATELKQVLVSAHSAVSGRLPSIQAWARRREEEHKRVERWQEQLHAQKMQWTDELAALQQRVREAEGQAHELRAQRDEREADAAQAEAAAEAARARRSGEEAEEGDPAGRYLLLLAGRAELLTDCRAAAARFAELNSDGSGARVWDDAALAELCAEAADFGAREPAREAQLQRLERLAAALAQAPGSGRWELSLYNARAALTEAHAVFARWDARLQQERQRRADYERCVDDFLLNQRKLVQWCAEQARTLEGHAEQDGSPAEVRKRVFEFCQSLQSRIPYMDENLAVLASLGAELVPGPKARMAEHALVDATVDWLKLQVQAYERIRDTLLAEHKDSGLRADCQAFGTWSRARVQPLLASADKLLGAGQDAAHTVRPALDTCRELQREFASHQLIVDHLADFEDRMELVTEHYERLKGALFSRLSMLCLRLNAFKLSFDGKEQYEEHMTNISTWTETKDGGTVAWEDVAEQLEEVKAILEREAMVDVALQDP
eukprot:TRINITY_DN15535_c0_g2_i1.p1 TRINITY_DN15535_c0_g2~~TRINITY_DN15535_c0_g2_i1.p1  ORF type:complete len:575 (+),score=233.48 TRINITY_DN15535_c0_g2_i1:85-1725(+)